MPRTAQPQLTIWHGPGLARCGALVIALAACGPSITPLRPRAPLPVPAAMDPLEPGTIAVPAPAPIPIPIPIPTPAAAAAEARADAEYFDANPLMVPVAGVAPSALRDSFNAARSGGRSHRALDIPARRGTPALAAVDGTILSLRQNTLGGTTLYLADYQRRFVYYYAHLDRYHDRMSEGVQVRQGEVLGYVGTSGNAPRDFPHLHFQALRVDSGKRDWWNGPPVDVRRHFKLTGRDRAL